MRKRRFWYTFFIVTTAFISALGSANSVYGQDNPEQDIASRNASILLTRLSAEEKIGQLFMVTMDGSSISEDAPIKELIQDYHLGGVLLKRTNENFAGSESILETTYSLIRKLQELEQENANLPIENSQESSLNDYIPLFVGISQSGDLFPDDQILNGLTAIPSQMAIGATWDTSIAEQTGVLLGRELAGLGFNLILNPSLDVLENPSGEGRGDLGVRTFGGDPFWVGEMGKAYIKGLHIGSIGKMAVIAKNFPGRGGSDRLPEEEVATVRKSLEQLKLIELAPFVEVTNIATTTGNSIADGLLLSHIRYQGFQGNIRATTRPVSFDQTALDLLLNLEPFYGWRQRGGILVSDDLGSQAIKKFFSPTGQTLDARQIVRNAFLAGSDLLYIDQLISTGDSDRFVTYKNVINHFIQKYQEDKTFASRVDESVLRILTLKYRLYPEFEFERILPSERSIINIGSGEEITFRIPSMAASLISPKHDQLNSALPDEPGINDRMVIFSDTLSVQQCPDCASQDIISVDALQNVITKLYGKSGSGQIQNQNIVSYSFIDLQDFINNPFNRLELETNLSRAKWILFVAHNLNPDREGSYALHNLLSEKADVLRDKAVVLFSFNAPYYFDATEISAFTAYYCLYTKIPAAFETAAKLLFKEISPVGSPPVSISGTAYNLMNAMSPNPQQIIELIVENPLMSDTNVIEPPANDEELPGFKLGDNLPIRTGVILDQNNHPVPDGTVVKFMLSEQGENLTIQQIESTTRKGIAKASFILQTPGRQEIRASAEPAMNSQILLVDISQDSDVIISAITPTPAATDTIEEQLPIIESLESEETDLTMKKNNHVLEWLFISIISWLSGYLFFIKTDFIKEIRNRALICIVIILGGLISGIWILTGLPGSFSRFGFAGYLELILWVLLGEIVTGMVAWVFYRNFTNGSRRL